MPEGQVSSPPHPRHHHRHHRSVFSSRPTVAVAAVAVAVTPPWHRSASASGSTSVPADSRFQHPQYYDPSRPATSSSLISAQPNHGGHVPSAARLPRTSSLLPPPQIVPSSRPGPHDQSNRLPPPSGQGNTPRTPPRQVPVNAAESSWFLNRWSTSTASSRASAAAHRAPPSRFGSRSSIDATSVSNRSPSSKPSPRKLQKSRRPSASSASNPENRRPSASSASNVEVVAPKPLEDPSQLPQALPPIVSLSPLEAPALSELLPVESNGAGPGSTEPGRSNIALKESQSPNTGTDSPDQRITATPASTSSMASYRPAMPYDQDRDAYAPGRGHSRSRSAKGSNDKGRGVKAPSQKAMLSRALQKANTAVQLDNAQNFEGAREAYAEACDLLQQVLQKTTAEEDKRKLEAIRRTYTSRIEELDQMTPWQEEESKALPARPESLAQQSESESILRLDDDDDLDDAAVFETATMTRVDNRSPQPPQVVQSPPRQEGGYTKRSIQNKPKPIVTTLTPEPGLLQSSFSRSPVRLRTPDNLLLQRPADPYMPAPLSPRRPPSPSKPQSDDMDEPIRSDFSMNRQGESVVPQTHYRDDSLNSWLDPIDESGGSTSSSVHSRTSSLGFRRKHIRGVSGETEAEFDTALDAAIEAAYDDGYEPMSPTDYERGMSIESGEEAVANALRKVELAHFYDDNSSDEEERILEEMARDYGIEQFTLGKQQPPVPRESDSSGATSRTWHSSQGSNPPTASTSLSTVTELPPPYTNISQAPAAPPPTQSLPELPQRPGSSAQSVRNRRLSGQNPKQLKIETAKLGPPLQNHPEDLGEARSAPMNGEEAGFPPDAGLRATSAPHKRLSPPLFEASPIDAPGAKPAASPFGQLPPVEGEESTTGRTGSPSATRLRKNFSSSSLRSMKSRNMSLTNLEEGSDLSPGTPGSNPFGSLHAPSVPALPTPLTTTFRERSDTNAAGLALFDDNFYSPTSPGSPNALCLDPPVHLEPCPTDFMLRPFWLMRCLYQTLAHPRGGYLSNKLFVPREVWRVKGVKLKNIEDKVANCDFLTAALLKIARVDTCDADAVLEEMQSLEGVLEQVQTALSRKLGNEVGVQGSGTLFKDASNGDGDAATGVPRSSSVSGKSAFSWRRLRSKNSAVGLGGSYTSRLGVTDPGKETPAISSLPMAAVPTSRPAKRDLSQVQFTGPNAMYMSSLARLFDAAQAIDQIARQVEDPGLRHADKTQVGLELCTRHAAEFFGFYVCRFVLSDLGLLLDKYIKRGSEWVLT
ncbi:hypothetical protein ACJZ2D_013508 [Fusarium nematophilum]